MRSTVSEICSGLRALISFRWTDADAGVCVTLLVSEVVQFLAYGLRIDVYGFEGVWELDDNERLVLVVLPDDDDTS